VESLEIDNPTSTTYVGQADENGVLTTLKLSIPTCFERVTFFKEFNGRRFKILDKAPVTDIPWTPGKRELKFMYRLPLEEIGRVFERPLDIPCAKVRVQVHCEKDDPVECALPLKAGSEKNTFLFESSGQPLPGGEKIRLTFSLSSPWIVRVRLMGLATLGILVSLTLVITRMRALRRGKHAEPQPRTP
jgi:hypothetical protein